MGFLRVHPFYDIFAEFERGLSRFESSEEIYDRGDTRRYFKDGILHREDGPAVIKYGKDGKAIEEQYFLEGVKKTKEEVQAYHNDKEDKKVHIVYLGEKAFKVTGKKLRELQEKLGLEEV